MLPLTSHFRGLEQLSAFERARTIDLLSEEALRLSRCTLLMTGCLCLILFLSLLTPFRIQVSFSLNGLITRNAVQPSLPAY